MVRFTYPYNPSRAERFLAQHRDIAQRAWDCGFWIGLFEHVIQYKRLPSPDEWAMSIPAWVSDTRNIRQSIVDGDRFCRTAEDLWMVYARFAEKVGVRTGKQVRAHG